MENQDFVSQLIIGAWHINFVPIINKVNRHLTHDDKLLGKGHRDPQRLNKGHKTPSCFKKDTQTPIS